MIQVIALIDQNFAFMDQNFAFMDQNFAFMDQNLAVMIQVRRLMAVTHDAVLPSLPGPRRVRVLAQDAPVRAELAALPPKKKAWRRTRPPGPLLDAPPGCYRLPMVSSAAAAPDPRMTLEEWADMDEDEPGELVDGRLVEEEVARNLHEVPVSWLVRTLDTWADPRGGWVFGSEHKLAVAPLHGRKPDVSMYLPGTRLRANAGLSRTPPAVVVEVASPTPRDVHRDRVEKLKEYAKFGVRFYWLLDPRTRLFEILELGADGRYTIAVSASGGTVAAPGCEGLTLDLDALWARVDRLALDEAGDVAEDDEDPDVPFCDDCPRRGG